LYSSQNIILAIKNPLRMRWAEMWHALCREEVPRGFCWGDLRDRGHLENSDIDGKIVLKGL
jgi:hypothetical protein